MRIPNTDTTRHNRGFTLIELAVVVFIIGIVLAVAFPRLLPVLLFSEHRAAARQLSDYGRAVMAKSALSGDKFTVHFSIDEQEYWTVRWVVPEPEIPEGEPEPDYLAALGGLRNDGMSSDDMAALMASKRFGQQADLSSIDPEKRRMFEEIDLEKAEAQFNDRFFKFAMRRTLARAENVKHENILEDISLFGDKFTLTPEDEPVPEEMTDTVLQRKGMPEGIYLDSVVVEGSHYSRGAVEIEISPLGMSEKVWFHVLDENGAAFTVFWNPFNNTALVYEGRRDFY